MNLKQAHLILDDENEKWSHKDAPKVQCDLLEGMKIIAESLKDEKYIDKAAEHDVFYYGSFEKSIFNMTEEQVRRMAQLGWGEEYDSWRHFV